MQKLNTEQTSNMKHHATATTKQQQAEKFARILSAMGAENDNEGLIRAFRQQQASADGVKSSKASNAAPNSTAAADGATIGLSSTHSSTDSEQGPVTPNAAAAEAAAAPDSGSTINFRPTDPIVLDAYRMLATSPTVPPAMQRPQWSSYDYHVLEKLYTGYASKVYKAVCKRSNQVVVLKSYQLSAICELYQHQIFREVALHASLKHEHVVQLSGAFQEGDFVVLVQEYAAGGNLFDLLQRYGGRLNEHVTVQMVLEPFLRVLQYLHTRGIIHRDIKPENILFTSDMTLKLADFGLAIDLRRERAVTRAGTLDYMAPEVLNCPYKNKPEENKEKAHLHYGGTVDSWAVGVLAYELLVGCPPFYDTSRDRVEQRIRSQTPAFPRSMSEHARSFITLALTKDASKRPSVLQLLNHPWINTYRARRSMRSININATTSPTTKTAAGEPAAAAAAAAGAGSGAAAAAAAGITHAHSLTMPPTPGSNLAGSAQAAGNFFSGTNAAAATAVSNPKAPAAAAAGGQPGSSTAAAAAAAAGIKAPTALKYTPASNTQSSAAVLASPRGLSLKAPQLQTMPSNPSSSSSKQGFRAAAAAAAAAVAAAAPAAADDKGAEVLAPCPMVSAKSSPLMIADMRELKMGVGVGLAGSQTPRELEGEVEGEVGEGEDGMRLRKKWLGLTKLWKEK